MADDREITRTITAKSTVPAGTAATGTATTNGSSIISVAGGNMAEWSNFINKGYRNVWIYLTTASLVPLAKVKGIESITANTISPIAAYLIYTDRPLPANAGDTFTIVIADLTEFFVKNNGAADSPAVDGAILKFGDAINAKRDYENGGGTPIQKDPITVDGTGTSLVITETK